MKSESALHLLLLMTLQLYHLPPSLLLHQQLFLPVHSMLVPVRQLLCCTAVLFKAQHCRVKSVFFTFCVCLFIIYYCVIKCYKPITVLYSRLCQLGTQANFVGLMNILGLTNTLSKQNSFLCRGPTVGILNIQTNRKYIVFLVFYLVFI